MRSIPEVHQLLSLGVITLNEARAMISGPAWELQYWEPDLETIKRAEVLRAARDARLDTTKEKT